MLECIVCQWNVFISLSHNDIYSRGDIAMRATRFSSLRHALFRKHTRAVYRYSKADNRLVVPMLEYPARPQPASRDASLYHVEWIRRKDTE